MQNGYPLVSSPYCLSKKIVIHHYMLFYLMDTWFLLTYNHCATTIVTTDCTEDTKLLSISKLMSHTSSIAASTVAMDLASMVEFSNARLLNTLKIDDSTQRMNTYSEVDYLDSLFDWNSELVYSMGIILLVC